MSIDSTLPWKYYKEVPSFIKDYPEVLDEGIKLIATKISEVKSWIDTEDNRSCPKNPIRIRQLFKLIYRHYIPQAFASIKQKAQPEADFSTQLRGDFREKAIESVYCPRLEDIGDTNTFILHSIATEWMDAISNIKISKFQEIETGSTKKNKKKKRRNKKKRIEETEGCRRPSSSAKADSNIQSAPVSKTIGDLDTKCANTPNRSRDRKANLAQKDQVKESLSDDNIQRCFDPTPIEHPGTRNLIKKKMKFISKEEMRKEKKRIKRQQRNQAAKIKKMVCESRTSGLESCSSVKKASCLSVAGSGKTAFSKEKQSRATLKHQFTGNLIIKHHPFVFEDEVVKTEVRKRCSSLCSGEDQSPADLNNHTVHRANSLDNIKQEGISHFELCREGIANRLSWRDSQPPAESFSTNTNRQRSQENNSAANTEVFKRKRNDKKAENSLSSNSKPLNQNVQKHGNMNRKQPLNIKAGVLEESQNHKQKVCNGGSISSKAYDQKSSKQNSSKQSGTPSQKIAYESLDISERYRRRTAVNPEYIERSVYKLRPKLERRYERYDENSFSSSSQLKSTKDPSPNVFKSQPQQLLLSESLGLSSICEASTMNYDAFSRTFDEDFYSQSFQMPLPFYCPMNERDTRTGLISKINEDTLNMPIISALEQEAMKFIAEMKAYSEKIERVRKICKRRLEEVSKVTFLGTDDLELKPYGSWETGLSIPGSDIDLLISTSGVDRELSLTMLNLLEENLKVFPWVSNVKNVSSAQIPVLKAQLDASIEFSRIGFNFENISDDLLTEVNEFVGKTPQLEEQLTRLSVDIIVETPETSALDTTNHVKESINNWPELHGLVLLLKYFLSREGLTNPFTGSKFLPRRAQQLRNQLARRGLARESQIFKGLQRLVLPHVQRPARLLRALLPAGQAVHLLQQTAPTYDVASYDR